MIKLYVQIRRRITKSRTNLLCVKFIASKCKGLIKGEWGLPVVLEVKCVTGTKWAPLWMSSFIIFLSTWLTFERNNLEMKRSLFFNFIEKQFSLIFPYPLITKKFMWTDLCNVRGKFLCSVSWKFKINVIWRARISKREICWRHRTNSLFLPKEKSAIFWFNL